MAELVFETRSWYGFLEKPSQHLVIESRYLLEREERLRPPLADFSYIVFPMAKAYEGFLKTFFFRIGVLPVSLFTHKQFRIGRSFNPDLPEKYKDEFWIYDSVEQKCGKETARALWDTWITCRNHVFHYFPNGEHTIALPTARKMIHQMDDAMAMAMRCTIK